TQLRILSQGKMLEARYLGLLESMPDAIVMVNPAGRIVLVNGQAEELFGYSRDELLGKPVEMLLPERFRNDHVAHRARYFAEPKTRAMGAGLELFACRRDVSCVDLPEPAAHPGRHVRDERDPRYHRAEKTPGGAAPHQRRAAAAKSLRAAGQPAEKRISRQHVARAAHAAQRHHRLRRDHA